jgi:hypothetical protein
MGAELGRIETDARQPLLNKTRVLSGRQSGAIAATCKQELTGLPTGQPQAVRQLEPQRPAGILLPDGRAVHGVCARRHIIDARGDEITAPQFAIQIEEGNVLLLALDLQLRPDRPDVAWSQRWLRADQLAFVPG